MKKPEIRVVNTIEELKQYKGEWQELLKENGNNNPFLEFDWIELWWKYFGKGKELFVLLIKVGDTVLGFFPLMITNRKFHKEITFISSYIDASYMDFIIKMGENETCINLAFDYIKRLKGNYIIKLLGFYKDPFQDKLLKRYLINNKANFKIFSFESPYIKIDKDDYETYLKKRSKHGSLKTLKRSKKKLYSSGDITFKKLAPDQFDKMYQLHEKRWRKKFDFSKLTEKQHQDFYKYLALNDDLSFKAHADGLMVGEKLIGFTYGFECNGKFIYYRIAHDDDFSVYGPGKIVLEEMVKKCFHNHMDTIDLGIGYARYKYEWTDDTEIVKEFVIASDSIFALLMCLKYRLIKKMIAFMKKFKWYDSFKIVTLGKVKYLVTNGYVKDIRTYLKKSKEEKNRVRVSMNNLLSNIYSVGEYTIYEKLLDEKMKQTNSIQNENKDDKDFLYEGNLNHIDSICEIMKKPVREIVKRFYNKQRCFVYYDRNKKECFWVDTKDFKIPAIKYEKRLDEKMKEKNAFILIEEKLHSDITKKTLSYIANVLQDSDFREVFVAIHDKNEYLKDTLLEIEYQPYQTIKYRKLFFKLI